MKTNIKIIATSLALTSSFGAWAGIGGLSVQSHLGQPFSGSIVVTGEEAAALQASRNVSVSGSGIRGSVTPQGNGNVVVRLRSSSPIREPIITFTVSAGRQTREYTAMLNPANYTPQPAPQHVEKTTKPTKNKTRQPANLESGERDFIERDTTKRSDIQENTLPVDDNNSATRKSTKSTRKNNQAAQSNDVSVATPAQPVHKSGKLAISPRRYRASAGETLISIANRHRPRNMSTQTAARALAMANPSVFKRGNTVQHSTTLYIPTPAQWYSYAERAQYHAPANRPARQTAPRASLPPVDTQPINQAAVENTAPATPTQPAKPVTPTAQPVTQPTQPAATTPPANAKNIASPAQPNAQPIADNQTASATNKNTTTAKTTAASQPANKAAKNTQTVAASGVQAASVVAASRASAPKPITVNADPQAAPEMPVDIPAEEEIDWVVYGAGAVGVAGLLGGLAYYLRRRTTESEPDDDGDVLVVEEKPTKKSKKSKKISLGKKAAAAAAVTTASTAAASEFEDEHDFDLDKENDFSKEFEALPDNHEYDDDGVFFATETENVNHSAPSGEFNLDDFEADTSSFNHDFKNQTSDSNDDWYLADNKNTATNETEWSLDSHYDNDQTHQAPTHDDDPFSAFNDDDDFPAAPKSQPMADEFDALLADIDNLEKEAASPSDDEDDIDAMFADKLAEDDELSEFASKKTKSPAAELDDIDAMFAGALDSLDSLIEENKDSEDDLSANELDSLNSLSDFSSFDTDFATTPVQQSTDDDDIDALFADTLSGLDLDAPNHQPHEQLVSDAELDSLNSLSDFDQLSAFEAAIKPQTAPVDDEMDNLLVDVLSDFEDKPVAAINKPIVSDAEIESLNSLSDLDNLDSGENMDSMFDDALADLDTLNDGVNSSDDLSNDGLDSLNSLSELDELAFETPAVSADIVEDEPVLDVDSMAFDLSAFDTLAAEHQDESNALAQPDDNDMAFDLSNFDLPTETELANLSVPDDVDSLDFGAPNHEDLEELGEFSDFELPELADANSDADIGFVSGAVSGSDTLEGKLDLAKMYIEIGDEDEARRMLRELTEEGDENMAAKAKALLANMS